MNWMKFSLIVAFLEAFLLHAQSQDFVADVLILKLAKEETKTIDQVFELDEVKSHFQGQVFSVKKLFPNKQTIARSAQDMGYVDLSRVYEVSSQNLQVIKVSNALKGMPHFEYVEPRYIQTSSLIPSDPQLSQQGYLASIKAFAAWDIQTGDTSIVIGINDTGTDLDHPDLLVKTQRNYADPINGIDDDGNGFIDDYNGWNFAGASEDVQMTDSDHGVHVAGIAAARTNNQLGIASTGFNCRYITAKTGNDRSITHGYDGIVYLADRGASIINCSWGGYTYSDFSKDVITYASINKDALVVCAAGNQNREEPHYPAAYEYTLAVGSLNPSNVKSGFSNYGYWLDICAPGEDIFSTLNDGQYGTKTGTSMAAPLVAGAAALVRSQYPQLTAMQTKAQLKATALDVDGVTGNESYSNKLGAGLLDMEAALSGFITDPAVVVSNWLVSDENDNAFVEGDTLRIGMKFTNYLAQSQYLTARLKINGPASLIDSTFDVGVLNTFQPVYNYSDPFFVRIDSAAMSNAPLLLEVEVSDGLGYVYSAFFEVLTNVDFINIDMNKVRTTATSNSIIGFNNHNVTQGLGFEYDAYTNNLLFEGGFMLGGVKSDTIKVLDNIRFASGLTESDFSAFANLHTVVPSVESDFDLNGSFVDTSANYDSMGVQVIQNYYAWNTEGNQNYVIAEYKVINHSLVQLDSVFAGVWMDFDIKDYDKNQAYARSDKKFAYSVYTGSGEVPIAGVQLLTNQLFNAYCMDNTNTGEDGITTTNGFNTPDKYEVLSTYRGQAGVGTSTGNDVTQTVSGFLGDIAPGDTATVAFALLGAYELDSLEIFADSAFKKYNGQEPSNTRELSQQTEIKVYPNPAKNRFTIESPNQKIQQVDLINLNGQLVHQEVFKANNHTVDVSQIEPGVYVLQVKRENGFNSVRIIIQ